MKNLKIYTSILLLSLISTNIYATENANIPKADIFVVEAPKDIQIKLKYPAVIQSYKNVEVIGRVLGVLEKKNFKEGQLVQKGDLLYEIEDSIYLAKLNEAKASLKMSEASLDNAKRNWERVKKLFSLKAVSKEKRDNSFSVYEQALASVSLNKAKLSQAQIEFNYTKVKAPISGITSLKKVDVGTLIQANVTKLIEITQNNKVYASFSIPMSDYKKIKNNEWITTNNEQLKLSLEIDGKITTIKGVVDFADVNIDAKTSIVKMRAVFDNSKKLLMSGQFVRVIIDNLKQEKITIIPQKAVLQNPKGTIVFTEKDGIVGVKPVIVKSSKNQNFIIKNGYLNTGDRIIINNFFRIHPGGKVLADKIVNKEK